MKDLDKLVEEIIEIVEANMVCNHTITEPTYDTPGHHDVGYILTKKGEEELRAYLGKGL